MTRDNHDKETLRAVKSIARSLQHIDESLRQMVRIQREGLYDNKIGMGLMPSRPSIIDEYDTTVKEAVVKIKEEDIEK